MRERESDGTPTRTGKGYVDYVLWSDDGAPPGLFEAKRNRRDPREGQYQTELYADALASASALSAASPGARDYGTISLPSTMENGQRTRGARRVLRVGAHSRHCAFTLAASVSQPCLTTPVLLLGEDD